MLVWRSAEPANLRLCSGWKIQVMDPTVKPWGDTNLKLTPVEAQAHPARSPKDEQVPKPTTPIDPHANPH